MKSSFCIDLQRFMLIPTKFPLSPVSASRKMVGFKAGIIQKKERHSEMKYLSCQEALPLGLEPRTL